MVEFIQGFNPEEILKKLVVIKIDTDISHLSINQKKVIDLLIKCAHVLEDIYYIQKYPENLKLRGEILNQNNPLIIQYYKVMAGPYDHFNNDEPYIKNVVKTDKFGFYPDDLTIKEWDELINKNIDKKDDFISPYMVIKRYKDELKPIPYSQYYKELLTKAHDVIKETLEYCENYSIKSYLSAQANAFLNNDFYEADIRWVQLTDNDIVPLLGAFECYDDKFLGYKASFTGIIGIKNKEENKKLDNILKTLDLLQDKLPIPKHYIKQKRGSISEIDIVNLIFSSGDARYPIHTAAFNLPNSHKIRSQFGSRKVLLYNIIEAKFNSVIIPISKILLDEKDQDKISFFAHFNFILMHEISHELGIGFIKDQNGKLQEITYFLKDLYPVIEEAKADVMGIYSLIFLQKQSYIIDCSYTEICIVYLMNLLRAIRFGIENAHGQASIMQFNFLNKEEVFIQNKNEKTFSIDFHKFDKSIEKLLTTILTFQGEGDYNKLSNFINDFSKIDQKLEEYLLLIKELPIDILPWFPKADEKKFSYLKK